MRSRPPPVCSGDERDGGRKNPCAKSQAAARCRRQGRCPAQPRTGDRRNGAHRGRLAGDCGAVDAGRAGRRGAAWADLGSRDDRRFQPRPGDDPGADRGAAADLRAGRRRARRLAGRAARRVGRGPLGERQPRPQRFADQSAVRSQADVRRDGVDRAAQGARQGRAAGVDRVGLGAFAHRGPERLGPRRAGGATRLGLERADLAAVRAGRRTGGDRRDRLSGAMAAPPAAAQDEFSGGPRRAQGERRLARTQGRAAPSRARTGDGRGRARDARGAVRADQPQPFRGRDGV